MQLSKLSVVQSKWELGDICSVLSPCNLAFYLLLHEKAIWKGKYSSLPLMITFCKKIRFWWSFLDFRNFHTKAQLFCRKLSATVLSLEKKLSLKLCFQFWVWSSQSNPNHFRKLFVGLSEVLFLTWHFFGIGSKTNCQHWSILLNGLLQRSFRLVQWLFCEKPVALQKTHGLKTS